MPGPLALPVVGKLVDLFADGASAWIKRKFPDPEAAAAADLELRAELANIDQTALSSFRDFVVAYEGAAADVHPAIQIVRGLVRPVLTVYMIALLTWAIGTAQDPKTIQLVWTLNLLSLGFWFGERALSRLGLNSDTIKAITGAKRNDVPNPSGPAAP